MFQLTARVPRGSTVNVAFSGGVDSLATALYFKNRNFDVKLLHFNHGCVYSDSIEKGCRTLSERLELPLIVGHNSTPPKAKQSTEDAWRRARYRFLYGAINDGEYVLTGHHINDVVETWIWSSMHGEGKIIEPYQEIMFEGKCCKLIRPFLMVTKDKLTEYVKYYGMDCVEDAFNKDNSLTRNYIRNVMMPHVLFVNPGIEKVIKKKYLKQLALDTGKNSR